MVGTDVQLSTLVVVVHELDDGELAVVCTVVIDVGGKPSVDGERVEPERLLPLGEAELPRPGPLGSSKAVEALTEAHRLRATDPPADVHPRHPRQETT